MYTAALHVAREEIRCCNLLTNLPRAVRQQCSWDGGKLFESSSCPTGNHIQQGSSRRVHPGRPARPTSTRWCRCQRPGLAGELATGILLDFPLLAPGAEHRPWKRAQLHGLTEAACCFLYDVQANPDLSSAGAFKLRHMRPGTVSLSLTESDEDPAIHQRPGFRNVQFLITTGPGEHMNPCLVEEVQVATWQ